MSSENQPAATTKPFREFRLKRCLKTAAILMVPALGALVVTWWRQPIVVQPDWEDVRDKMDKVQLSAAREAALSQVLAQLREATVLDGTAWTSQPGAIRTFHHADADRNRLYKLYSSRQALVRGVQPGDRTQMEKVAAEDLGTDWATRPDEWVDLNQPLHVIDPQHPDSPEHTKIVFPIADPRSTAAGFQLKGGVIPGVSTAPAAPALPMPVRWVYLLKDGTMGTLQNGIFTSTSGTSASESNRIVARMAWWTDDESCKINVNTASTPAFWATPITDSREDHTFATSQPMLGEFQRYPGHPATVDLGAVLFPRKRWVPPRLRSLISPGGGSHAWSCYSPEEVQLLWTIAPFIRESLPARYGSFGGEQDTWKTTSEGMHDSEDHLFASLDEVYFRARRASQSDFSHPRDHLREADPGGVLLQNLERGGFFLTAKSESPEISLHRHPRLSLYPQHSTSLAPILQSVSGATQVSLPLQVTPYDVTLGVNTMMGKRAYYFQRSYPDSRHGELGMYDDKQRLRNRHMWEYLKRMTQLPVPGYPEYAGAPQAFLSKYAAPAGAAGDSSDHAQILLAMVDYVRSINMSNDLLEPANQYNGNGNGHLVGVCGCQTMEQHEAALGTSAVIDPKDAITPVAGQQPKGYGRTACAHEVGLVGSTIWVKRTPGEKLPEWLPAESIVNAAEMDTRAGMVVQLSVVASAFSPAQGFPGLNAPLGLGLQENRGGYGNHKAIPAEHSPLLFLNSSGAPTGFTNPLAAGSTHETSLLRTKSHDATASGLINWGGQTGPKVCFGAANAEGTNVASLGRIFVPQSGASISTPPVMDRSVMNVALYESATPTQTNIFQVIKVRLPPSVTAQIDTLPHPEFPHFGSYAANAKEKQTPAFDGKYHKIWSYVVPHGDWRLTQGVMNVEADVLRPHEGNTLGPWPQTDPGVDISGKEKTGLHSMWEPLEKDFTAQSDMLSFSRYGIVAMQKGQTVSVDYPPGMPMHLPHAKLAALEDRTVYTPASPELIARSSGISRDRGLRFGYCRRDTAVFRGSCDPADTGDFDNGVANSPDGPYLNYPDHGDNRDSQPYYDALAGPRRKSPATFSPNRIATSAVMFGSLPTGVMMRVPWQTLRFRPDPGMNDDQLTDPPPGQPFSNYRTGGILYPRDHHLLDYWWMPVVEPWSISEPFSTKGQINMNQELLPFGSYIERLTGLYAVFQGERMTAIDVADSTRYKAAAKEGTAGRTGAEINVRRFVNPDIMAHQFRRRYAGFQPDTHRDIAAPFNVFRSASELCELWMAPERSAAETSAPEPMDDDPQAYLAWIQGPLDGTQRTVSNSFWEKHKLTGDNARERPYASIYPKLTTRSNVFRVHLVVQTLRQSVSNPPDSFDARRRDSPDLVVSEWRGHALIERTLDPRDPELNLPENDYLTAPSPAPVDRFYTFPVTELQQFTE